jgi:hypothetical protein
MKYAPTVCMKCELSHSRCVVLILVNRDRQHRLLRQERPVSLLLNQSSPRVEGMSAMTLRSKYDYLSETNRCTYRSSHPASRTDHAMQLRNATASHWA